MEELQELAEKEELTVDLCCLSGSFISFNTSIAYCNSTNGVVRDQIAKAVIIANDRTFEDDPRFGMIALSEIASRALSPGINDPGTAIQIIGSMVRIFSSWQEVEIKAPQVLYNRISVPAVSISDLFTDAFRPIARDGAGNIEVMVRLQKGLIVLEALNHPNIKKEARYQSLQAFKRAELAMDFQADIEELRNVALFNFVS